MGTEGFIKSALWSGSFEPPNNTFGSMNDGGEV